MKKMTKITMASVVALGTLFGVGYSIDNFQVNEAHAAQNQTVTPYYTYNGYAAKGTPSFVLNQTFINSLKYDNFKMNGVKIPYTTGKQALPNEIKNVQKYDQTFAITNSKGTVARYVTFKVNGKLTTKQLMNAYGNKLKLATSAKGLKVYVYNPYKQHYGIAFYTNNGKVQSVMIGHFLA